MNDIIKFLAETMYPTADRVDTVIESIADPQTRELVIDAVANLQDANSAVIVKLADEVRQHREGLPVQVKDVTDEFLAITLAAYDPDHWTGAVA